MIVTTAPGVNCKYSLYSCSQRMNFDLADLRAFLSVADFASFRAASDNLHLSQSALSRRIDKLEAALGVKLFSRTTRKVELTTVGRAFVPKARNVMRELEDALVGIKDTTERISGQVTIACVPSAVGYFLPVAIKRFHTAYPKVRIRLIDESSAEILVAVARGDADFGLTYIGTQESDIDFEPLLEERFVVACPAGHPLAKHKRVTWAELSEHEYVTIAQGSGNRFLIDQALSHVENKPQWICEVRHVPALVSLVEAGPRPGRGAAPGDAAQGAFGADQHPARRPQGHPRDRPHQAARPRADARRPALLRHAAARPPRQARGNPAGAQETGPLTDSLNDRTGDRVTRAVTATGARRCVPHLNCAHATPRAKSNASCSPSWSCGPRAPRSLIPFARRAPRG
jgi:DNA-binding transcriptional LysR family regulator